MLNILAAIIGVYGIVVVALFFLQRGMIYHPGGPLVSPEMAGVAEMKPVSIISSNGSFSLTSWYKPAAGKMPTIVFFQGNAGNIDSRSHKARPFLDAGFGMLLVGYRGFGGNPGKPSEQGLYSDARANLEFLASKKVPPGKWVMYGESLGTGIAVQMAFERADKTPLGAVILESPYTSLGDAGQAHYPFIPVRILLRDRFRSLDKIAAIKSPLFVFHGTNDNVIPVAQGRALFQAAGDPKQSLWVDGAGHNNLHEFGAAKKVMDFITQNISR